MSDSYKPHRPTAKRLLTQIGSRYALSNPVLLFFLIPAYGTGLIFEAIRLDDSFAVRLAATTAGYLATIIPLLIARTFLFRSGYEYRPVAVILVFLTAGLLRGITLLSWDLITGAYSAGDEYYRILGGPIFTFATLSVAAVIASNYQRHRIALVALADERYRLEIRSAGIRAKVQVQREELLEKIRSLLDPAISNIQGSLSKNSSASALASIQAAVEEVVRPLSLEVASASDDVEAETGKAVIREKADLPEKLVVGEFLLPGLGGLITSVTLLPVCFSLETPPVALFMVAGLFLSIFTILGLAQILFRRVSIHPIAVGVIVTAFNGLALTPFYLITPLLDLNVRTAQINTLVLFGTVLGASLFFAQFVQLQRKSTTNKLLGVNQQLEMLNASLRQELWLNRRRTASVLHGPVQAALYASAMKFSQARQATPELVLEVEKDIQDSLEKLNNPSNLGGEQVSEVLNQIVEIWSDAAEISISFEPELGADISSRPLASEALVEISREFINNAIKHGKAETVSLRVFRLDAYRFAVEVIDDGQGVPPGAKPGLGSKILTELSLVWNQSRLDDKTVSYAEIVLGQDKN
jgi:signal transduction histidine kinase